MKEVIEIWLYPDNPMSIGTLIFFGIIFLFLLKNKFLSLVVDELKNDKRKYNEVQAFSCGEQEDVDVVHAIGQNLAYFSGAEELHGLMTATGMDAEEVYVFMEELLISSREVLKKYEDEKRLYPDNVIDQYVVHGGEMHFKERGLVLYKTIYGNFEIDVNELEVVLKNPYKFDRIAYKLNLI